jgi:lysophospholipase L1-like esterase
VTVTLGGTAASQTYVSCEANRGLLKPVSIAAGQSQTYAFVVNVRTKESEPAQASLRRHPGAGHVLLRPDRNSPSRQRHWLCLGHSGHETHHDLDRRRFHNLRPTGFWLWGLGPDVSGAFHAPIGIANYADSGESSSSFYGSSLLWGAIKSQWTAGDWVFIQFGHNDKGVADATVQTNLEKYVTDAQAAKVNAILVSPPARVGSIPIGDQSSLHAVSASGAAKDKGVPFVDLTALSTAWYDGLGLDVTEVKAKYHAGGRT